MEDYTGMMKESEELLMILMPWQDIKNCTTLDDCLVNKHGVEMVSRDVGCTEVMGSSLIPDGQKICTCYLGNGLTGDLCMEKTQYSEFQGYLSLCLLPFEAGAFVLFLYLAIKRIQKGTLTHTPARMTALLCLGSLAALALHSIGRALSGFGIQNAAVRGIKDTSAGIALCFDSMGMLLMFLVWHSALKIKGKGNSFSKGKRRALVVAVVLLFIVTSVLMFLRKWPLAVMLSVVVLTFCVILYNTMARKVIKNLSNATSLAKRMKNMINVCTAASILTVVTAVLVSVLENDNKPQYPSFSGMYRRSIYVSLLHVGFFIIAVAILQFIVNIGAKGSTVVQPTKTNVETSKV